MMNQIFLFAVFLLCLLPRRIDCYDRLKALQLSLGASAFLENKKYTRIYPAIIPRRFSFVNKDIIFGDNSYESYFEFRFISLYVEHDWKWGELIVFGIQKKNDRSRSLLDVFCNIFSFDENTLEHRYLNFYGKLDAIDLRNCSDWSVIRERTFSNLKPHLKQTLIIMNLTGNDFSELPRKLFSELPNLRAMRLDGNEFVTLHHDQFKENIHLEEINLSHNRLRNLSGNMFKYHKKLRKLYLQFNEFVRLPDNIFQNLAKEFELNLAYNDLIYLQDELTHGLSFDNTTLDIAGNFLSCLPNKFLKDSFDVLKLKNNCFKKSAPICQLYNCGNPIIYDHCLPTREIAYEMCKKSIYRKKNIGLIVLYIFLGVFGLLAIAITIHFCRGKCYFDSFKSKLSGKKKIEEKGIPEELELETHESEKVATGKGKDYFAGFGKKLRGTKSTSSIKEENLPEEPELETRESKKAEPSAGHFGAFSGLKRKMFVAKKTSSVKEENQELEIDESKVTDIIKPGPSKGGFAAIRNKFFGSKNVSSAPEEQEPLKADETDPEDTKA